MATSDYKRMTDMASYPNLESETTPIGFEGVGSAEDPKKDPVATSRDTADEKKDLLESVEEGKKEAKRSAEETVYFEDGKSKIDFVLAYRLKDEERDNKHDDDQKKRDDKRNKFRENCEKEYHLVFEDQDCSDSPDQKTYYWKVHCTWQGILEGAERIGLRLPISDNTLDSRVHWRTRLMERYLKLKDPFAPNIPEKFNIPHYLTAPFRIRDKDRFIYCSEENADKFLTEAQRSMIVWDSLQRAGYGPKDGQYGIERLLSNKTFLDAFPLHDGPYQTKKDEEFKSLRQLLYKRWAHPLYAFHKNQPLNHIRQYFGEKVGMYFTWVGHYTYWLLWPTIIGIIVMLYGISTVVTSRNPIAADACGEPFPTYQFNDSGVPVGPPDSYTFYMCPICDTRCDFWYYQAECTASRAFLLFDNGATVFYAVIMSFWAVLFLEFWKRKQFVTQHYWDTLDFEAAEQRPRIQFERKIEKEIAKCKTEQAKEKYRRWNPVHEKYDLVQPDYILLSKILAGFTGLVFMAMVVIIIVFAVIIYRIAIAALLYLPLVAIGGNAVGAGASLFASITGACVQLVFIMVMNVVYKKIAVWLNDWEQHRTQTEYEDSLILKLYIFQFVNFYSSIFYIAFFRGNLVGYPGGFNRVGAVRWDECATYGCFLELTIQLIIILLGKQILNNCVEIGVPLIKWIKNRLFHKDEGEDAVYARWERDFDLPDQDKFGLIPEYLELVIQYGFITIFVAAFPLAPLFALLNNWVEIRLDAYKYLVTQKRPVAERSQDIGAWYSILDFVSKLAVVTNALLIAITADFIPILVHRYETNRDMVCSQYPWPSCDITGNEYQFDAGYLDASIQRFSVEEVFREVKEANPDAIVPNIGVYRLRAYLNGTREQQDDQEEPDYIFLPFINLTCLNQRTNLSLTYADFTVDYLQGTDETTTRVIDEAQNCIRSDAVCGFRGWGRIEMADGTASYPRGYYQEWAARLAFIIVFEHVIFIAVAVIAWLIPDVPETVQNEIKKEKLLALEATLSRPDPRRGRFTTEGGEGDETSL